MVRILWEIDACDTDANIDIESSPEEQALKHARAISNEYFNAVTWTFSVELDNGQVFSVDLETDEVTRLK